MARALKLTVEQLAEGIVRVANANMERAIRLVSVERGHDPREFVLLAFGGAGGMHACALAERLEMRSVLVPRHAGVLSALGMLMADVTKDYSASVLRPSRRPVDRRARAPGSRRSSPRPAGRWRRKAFAAGRRRFGGCSTSAMRGSPTKSRCRSRATIAREFDRAHARLYGYANPIETDRSGERPRDRRAARPSKPALPFERVKRRLASAARRRRRRGRFSGRPVDVRVSIDGTRSPGAAAPGPAVITGGEATVVVPPGLAFKIDGFGNVVVPVSVARRPQ